MTTISEIVDQVLSPTPNCVKTPTDMTKRHKIIDRLQQTNTPPESVGVADVRDSVTQVSEHQWEIDYHGAVCKFESQSEDIAIIYHCEVPEPLQQRGIGTALIRAAEQTIREQTNVEKLHASIGTSGGATKYILCNKCGFVFGEQITRDGIGTVINAEKSIE